MGKVKRITIDIASKIYERNETAIKAGKQLGDKELGFSGRDFLSHLMLANKREKGGLSKDRILNNVSS